MNPKCPKCGKVIDHLTVFVSGTIEYYMDAENNYQETEFLVDEDIEEHRCPECDAVLFISQPIEAIEFLKGK